MVPVSDPVIAQWVVDRVAGVLVPPQQAIGVMEDGKILAGASFYMYSGNNIFVDIAIDDRRATRMILYEIGRYAFETLGCRRLTMMADSSNLRSVTLHEKLGATVEAVIKDAIRDGNDIRISVLWHDCEIWRKLNGQRRKRTIRS